MSERKLFTSSEGKVNISNILIPNNSVLKFRAKISLTFVYNMTDKGDCSTRQKKKKEAECSDMNAIMAELRSHRDEFKTMRCVPPPKNFWTVKWNVLSDLSLKTMRR